MPFTHLHVSRSSRAPRGGPWADGLADAALADGATALACTDRDGLERAVEHVGVCLARGLDAVVGVDIAVLAEPEVPEGTADDGATHDRVELHAGARRARRGSAGVGGRVVVLAHGGNGGVGWRALCRLVSDAHAHTRGRTANGSAARVPVGVLRSEIAARCLDPETGRPVLTVLLGADSDVGRAMGGRKFLRPRTLFREWVAAMPAGVMAVELVTHRTPRGERLSTDRAVRMLRLATEHGLPAVLTNAVLADAVPAGLADAVLADGPTPQAGGDEEAGEAWFKPAEAMQALGAEIISSAGLRGSDLENLLVNTERIADRCRLDPVSDIGWRADSSGGDPELDPAAVVAEVAHVIRGLGVRLALRGAGAEGRMPGAEIAFDVEAAGLNTVYRAVAEHFGEGRVALVRAADGLVGPLAHGGSACVPVARGPAPDGGPSASGQAELLAEPSEQPAAGPRPGPVHPCGVVIGDSNLLDRLPVEPSGGGLPMSQIDRHGVERLGLLVIEVRGEGRLSALAHAAREAARVEGAGQSADAAAPGGTAAVGGESPGVASCAWSIGAQSAWFEAHHPASFLAGVAEHDAGTNPTRYVAAEARRLGIPILSVDINRSGEAYRVEPAGCGHDSSTLGVRRPFSRVGGLSRGDVRRLVAGQPYSSVSDVQGRAGVRPGAIRRLAELGAFDSLHRAAADEESRAELVAQLARLAEPASRSWREPSEGQLQLELELAASLKAAAAPP